MPQGTPQAIRQGTRRSGAGLRVAGLLVLGTLGALGSTACALDSLLHSDQVPADVSDPAITQTPEGARYAYNGALAQFRAAFAGEDAFTERCCAEWSFAFVSGLLTDELQAPGGGDIALVDRRALVEGTGASTDGTYAALQKVRNQAAQALGLLSRYLPDEPAFQAHLYAMQGYAEVFLAELFCSGIPLSTVDYSGDYTYQPGVSTEDVLAHAVTRFDSALALAGDSLRFVALARVGKARALLALGQSAAAAAAVAEVADDYRYDVSYSSTSPTGGNTYSNFGRIRSATANWTATVPDAEGGNGLDWRGSADPRTPMTARPHGYYYPANFDTLGGNPIVLASGLEARLIEAEAALTAGDAGTWLATLNALRTDGTFETPDPRGAPGNTDTLWHAGTGGTAGLAPLTDPGTADGRVDLLFRERAFWLFLTGHRQGDLRRLLRQYGRQQDAVYPVGFYPYGASYGGDVTAPIPSTESANPLFTGCSSRSA